MRMIVVAGLLAIGLAGCQTAQESLADAEVTCEAQGFRPGTRAYNNCRSVNYRENRRQSNDTANAVAAGAAAGIIGGALVGAAVAPRGYYCRGWGCW